MVPAQTVKFGHVRQLAHRAVRFGCIERDLPVITHGLFNQTGQVVDADFPARTDVDVAVTHLRTRALQIGKIHPFHDEDTGIGHLPAPEELAQRRAGAPERQPFFSNSIFFKQADDLLPGSTARHAFHGTTVQIPSQGVPVLFCQTFGQMYLADHRR